HGAAAGSPLVDPLAQVLLPQLLAAVIESHCSRLAPEDIDPIRIDSGRSRRIPVLVAPEPLQLGQLWLDVGGPQLLAGCAVQTDQMEHQILHRSLFAGHIEAGIAGEEDLVAKHHGAGGSRTWQLRLPRNVFGAAPLGWQPFGRAGSLSRGAA